jgi:hypothetical protein
MRAETLVRAAAHHVKPLVIRGGLAHTFGSLASFLAVLFLLFGLYLLGDAFEHPLAAILFYFLCKPRYGQRPRTGWFRRAE